MGKIGGAIKSVTSSAKNVVNKITGENKDIGKSEPYSPNLVNNPTQAKIVNLPVGSTIPPNVSRGGGSSGGNGSSGSSVQPPQLNPVINPSGNIITPSKYNVAKDMQTLPTRNTSVNVALINQQRQAQEPPRSFWDKFTNKSGRANVVNQETINLQGGTRTNAFTGSGKGTIVQTNVPYTNQEIVKLGESGKVSETAVFNELNRREQDKYGREANFVISAALNSASVSGKNKMENEYNNVQTEVNNYANQIQNDVQSGKISVNEANKKLDGFINNRNTYLSARADEYTAEANETIKSNYSKWLESRGAKLENESKVYLNKVSDRIQFQKTLGNLPIIIGAGIITGEIGSAIAGTGAAAAAIVGTVGRTALAVGGLQAGSYVYQSYKEGVLTPTRIANLVIPFAAFGGGAYAGSRLAAPRVNEVALKTAIGRANIESRVTKGITTETQIRALKIPEADKIELLGKLNSGGSIKVVDYKIKAGSASDEAIIKKGIPRQDIQFIEITDRLGNIINRISVGKVKVGRGAVSYKEKVLSVGRGTSQKGFTDIESLSVSSKNLLKEITSASKTRDISKANVRFPEDNQLLRILESRTKTFEGKKISQEKPIKFEDLQKIIDSRANKLSSRTKYAEVQELKNIKLIVEQKGKIGKTTFEKTYTTKGGGGRTIKEPSLIEFTRTTKGSMKPLDYSETKLSKDISKAIKSSGQSQVQMQNLKIENIPPTNLETSIKQSLQQSAKNLNVKPIKFAVGNQQKNKIKNINKQIESGQLSGLDFGNLKRKDILGVTYAPANINRFNQAPREAQAITPAQIQSPAQVQKQINKLMQIPKQAQVPTFEVPNFPIPKIPEMPPIFPFISRGQNAGQKQLKAQLKKLTKRSPKYTASLGAAAFQIKPFKVTKKQYEQLSKQVYTGAETRPLLEIVGDKEMKKLIKSVKI